MPQRVAPRVVDQRDEIAVAAAIKVATDEAAKLRSARGAFVVELGRRSYSSRPDEEARMAKQLWKISAPPEVEH